MTTHFRIDMSLLLPRRRKRYSDTIDADVSEDASSSYLRTDQTGHARIGVFFSMGRGLRYFDSYQYRCTTPLRLVDTVMCVHAH